ncbi:MAG: hypothetical protein CM15mP74_29420 [Halieaceae bacterium]|nr:MAG: hypothetical protein CM15mP74_29420 [Halieaceae bacterium]
MEDLAPTREKWYQEFFDRLRTTASIWMVTTRCRSRRAIFP